MKTIYSMQEFYDEVLDLAKTKNEDYCWVQVQINHKRKAQFDSYINGYGMHKGDTMEESIQKLRDKMNDEEIKNIDVEVEQELLVNSEK